MVLRFMRRKHLNDPTLILHFCDYPPFEEDVDLHLNKLQFPSRKTYLDQVWLKMARCFILKDSFQNKNVKIVSPLVSPILTLRNHNLYKLCTMSKSLDVYMSYFGSMVLNNFFSMPPNFRIFVIISPLKKTWPFIWTI
jgi:hypothetical protein